MKEVQLTQGYTAIVDDEDYERVSKYNWCPTEHHNGVVYVRHVERKDGRNKILYLHRFILNAESGQICDHIDHDGLNNQKSNLRFATNQQNIMNRVKNKTSNNKPNSSKYKGAVRHNGRWMCLMNGYVGMFDSEEECARAYDVKAKELFGEFACLNFPESK